MQEITLKMPYYFNDKFYNVLSLKAIEGFVDVISEDNELMYSGLTVDAMNYIHKLNN